MKNKIYLYLTCLLLGISCSKDDVPVNIFEPGAMEFGSASAQKNGLQWQASAVAIKNKNDKDHFSIEFCTYNIINEKRESVSFAKIPYRIANYTAVNCSPVDSCPAGHVKSIYGRLSSDGDALLALYYINDEKNSYLNITAIDTITNIVRGDFKIHLEIDTGEEFLGPADPNNLDFTKGSFECRFSN